MNIALVTTRLEVGGLETVLKSLAQFFLASDLVVDIVEISHEGPWSSYFRRLGFNVITLEQRAWTPSIHHAKRVALQLKKYDAILLNDAPLAMAALGLLPAKAVVIPILHLDIPSFVRNAIANAGEWDFVAAVSPGLKDTLLKSSGVSPDKIVCIANGIEVAAQWPKTYKDFLERGVLRVAYVGRIEKRQKGAMHLPGITKKAEDLGCDLTVSIIGDGPDLQELKEQCASRCPNCSLLFYGTVEHAETLELLLRQDVLLMPSYFEGLPIALLEAMAQGVVPIVSRLPGQTDPVVVNGDSGFLVDAGDEDGFACALRSVYFDRTLLGNLSRRAWETVENGFSTASMGNAYLSLIRNAVRAREMRLDGSRSGRLEMSLLGDLPYLPLFLVRPIRKFLRVLGLWSHRPNVADHFEVNPIGTRFRVGTHKHEV